MAIRDSFAQLATDEGNGTAIATLERLQASLETVMEVGDEEERKAAELLLDRVQAAIKDTLLVSQLTPDMIEWSWIT